MAAYGTAAANVASYHLESQAYNQETSMDGYIRSAVSGFVQGSISFMAGIVSGKLGLYNFANKPKTNAAIQFMYKPTESIIRAGMVSLPAWSIRQFIIFMFELGERE